MKIKVEVNRYLTKFFNEIGELEVDVKNEATVRDLLIVLKNQHEAQIPSDISTEVELRRYFIVVINGKFASLSDNITEGNKKIKLIPPISGG